MEINYTNGVSRFSQTFSVQPGEVANSLRKMVITASNFSTNSDNRLFLSKLRGAEIPFMIDQFGDICWTINEILGHYGIQQTMAGKIVIADDLEITEAELSGEITRYEIPSKYGSIHHDLVPISNTEYLLTVDSPDGETVEDYIILFDTEKMLVTREWDLKDSIPKMTLLIEDDIDWLHVNALAFDNRDQSILVSGQRSAVAKVSWDNELVWVITDPARLAGVDITELNGLEGKSAEEITLIDFAGDVINWGQHDIRIDPISDSYYLFDNSLERFYGNEIKYSRGVNFTIDPETKRLEVMQTFGEGRSEYYSPIISGIEGREALKVALTISDKIWNKPQSILS